MTSNLRLGNSGKFCGYIINVHEMAISSAVPLYYTSTNITLMLLISAFTILSPLHGNKILIEEL